MSVAKELFQHELPLRAQTHCDSFWKYLMISQQQQKSRSLSGPDPRSLRLPPRPGPNPPGHLRCLACQWVRPCIVAPQTPEQRCYVPGAPVRHDADCFRLLNRTGNDQEALSSQTGQLSYCNTAAGCKQRPTRRSHSATGTQRPRL